MKKTLSLLAAVAGLLWLAAPTAAVFPGANGLVLFTSHRLGSADIFTAKADGSDARIVIGGSDTEAQAAWSPDGRKIAFRRGPDGASEVWVANADGSNQQVLTNTGASFFSSQPAWSTDGRIFFRSDRDGDPNIWVMSADGTNEKLLVGLPGDQRYPTPSPDGHHLVFRSDADGDPEIWVATIDGTERRQLTNNDLFDSAPSWSPDGRRIVFERRTADGNTDIYVMDQDGRNEQRLTSSSTPILDEGPVFSPDGASIVYTSERDGNSEIYVMKADGSDQRPLVSHAAKEESPDWQAIPATGVLEKIDLYVRPRRVTQGRVAILRFEARVFRDGKFQPVEGATIRFAGLRAKTNAVGYARVRKRMRKSGLYTARASRSGYRSGTAKVRVRKFRIR